MKKSKVLLSIILVLSILVVSILPVLAESVTALDKSTLDSATSKISKSLKEKLETLDEDEEIPVWLWFKGIDTNNVIAETEKVTGLTEDMLNVINQDSVSTKLIDAIDKYSINSQQFDKAVILNEMKDYMSTTKTDRETEKTLTNTYRNTKRMIAKKAYINNNENIIKKLGLSEAEFVFKSTLSPSAIVYLSKNQIQNLAKSSLVEEMYLFNKTIYEAPDNSYTNPIKTMRSDTLATVFGLTGNEIDVLMIDHDFVRPDTYTSYSFSNLSLIKNILNQTEYPLSNTSSLPSATNYHATMAASALQVFAPDSNIYSVSSQTEYNMYSDIEWAISEFEIDIISGSVNLSTPLYYNSDPNAKWFDGLVAEHDVTLIASAGNGMKWNKGWRAPRVISPACGYNSIAVGAYQTNGNPEEDTMHNFRYSPTSGNDLPCYKPDIVIASGSTSRAAPCLSGIVACLLEMKPNATLYPEEVKAILMASCHRKVKPTSGDTQELMSTGLTVKQGAGAVDAFRAARIMMTDSYGYATITSGEIVLPENIKVKYDDNLNVSIAWSRQNDNQDSYPDSGTYNGSLGTVQELNLDIVDSSFESQKNSSFSNSGKQLAYLENASPSQNYKMQITKVTENNTEEVRFGYAWSERGIKKLQNITMSGLKAQGQTLSVSLSNSDGTIPDSQEDVRFSWERSSDGYNWETIANVTSEAYTLTQNDYLKYIRCIVTPTNSSLLSNDNLIATTDTKIVIYGDVDLDGSVTSLDATLIQRYLYHLETFIPEQMIAADVDLDGNITIWDASYIQRYISGLVSALPIQ